jgi:hypothetical protein
MESLMKKRREEECAGVTGSVVAGKLRAGWIVDKC